MEGGHAIVGFNTTDEGMIYVEPQTDEIVKNLEIGKRYWSECVIPNSDESDYDNTIDYILIY